LKRRTLRIRPQLTLLIFLLGGSLLHLLRAQTSDEQLAQHQQRAQEAEARQDFGTAIREYRILLRAVPGNPELESNLGIALYFHHDLAQAAEVFRHAIAVKPALYTPHLFLGLALANLSRPDASVEELQKAEALNADDPLVHMWLGYDYTAQSHFEKAAEQLQIAAALKSQDQDIWFALGRCYLEMGKAATEELLRAAPDSGRTWQLAAEQYEAQGNNGKALQFYAVALRKRPDLGVLRDKVTSLGGAIATDNAPATVEAAAADHLYERIHEDEAKAREAFERVSRIDPDSYRAHQVLADASAASDHFDDAIREYRLVIEKKPDLPGIHGELCNALSRTAHIDEAIRECDAELTLSPYAAGAYVQAARVRLLADDDAHAQPLLQKALTLDRPPIAAYKLLGKIDLSAKRYPAAAQELSRYVAVEAKDASAWFLLARAYKAVGDTAQTDRAIAAYKRESSLSKASEEARRVLDANARQDISPREGSGKEADPL
jgi:tetratricopeptide (TPR) repeat protein